MPNWSFNHMHVAGKSDAEKAEVKRLRDTIKSVVKDEGGEEETPFSFEKVIPMPPSLKISASSAGEDGLVFLYYKSSDQAMRDKINRVYRSMNMFHKNIEDEGDIHKHIRDNLEGYEKDAKSKEAIELGRKYLDNFDKYGCCHWYEWSIFNWGTKWDACDAEDESESDDELSIKFDTAWSFPAPVAARLSEMFPTLVFYFDAVEESGAFDFEVKFKAGEVIYYAEWKYEEDGDGYSCRKKRVELPPDAFWK